MREYDGSSEQPDEEHVAFVVEVFRMLSDATRVRLLWALLDTEMAVNDLAAAVQKPQATVSQHLAKLRMARLVTTRRNGAQIIYRVENDHVRQLVKDAVYNAEHASTDVPQHHRPVAPGTLARLDQADQGS